MKVIPQPKRVTALKHLRTGLVFMSGVLVVGFLGVLSLFVETSKQGVITDEALSAQTLAEREGQAPAFPVGVDPKEMRIVENPIVDSYFNEHVAKNSAGHTAQSGFVPRILGKLALMSWYQNLASLSSRVLIIQSGERKEQVVDNFGKILKWDAEARAEFEKRIVEESPELEEGKFFPGAYTVSRNATPAEVAPLVLAEFRDEVLTRYSADVSEKVPLRDALTIASLLEREAYDFEDMRHISGVIWNRLFTDMKLQIDATLQYAKGSKPTEAWWPKVRPADKFIASAYNTYEHEGLPPAPIANPSLDAVLAALNPRETKCMYYFHDKDGGFHCAETYEEHVKLLKQYYGRGK